jgi:hypothetical protein
MTTAEAKNEAKHNLAVDLNLIPFDTMPPLAQIASLQTSNIVYFTATRAVNAPHAPADELRLRRLAVQLGEQLPEDPHEAIRVIELCKELHPEFPTGAGTGAKSSVVQRVHEVLVMAQCPSL